MSSDKSGFGLRHVVLEFGWRAEVSEESMGWSRLQRGHCKEALPNQVTQTAVGENSGTRLGYRVKHSDVSFELVVLQYTLCCELNNNLTKTSLQCLHINEHLYNQATL